MTNKLNDIDVSECEFYNDCECDAYRHEYWEPQDNTKDMCKEHEDCYFKQLARLQEENKEKINILEQIINILYPNANDDELYDVTFNGEYINKLKKVVQALEEIRKLLFQIDENNWLHTGKHIYMDNKCISELKTRIQNKIDKVLK